MKKTNRQSLLAIFTFLALVLLLVVQVSWIFNAAKTEEKNFNRMVNKALTEAREEIGHSASSCTDMKNYLCGIPCKKDIQKQKIAEIDSIIESKLEIYHIDLDYTFEITNSSAGENNKKLFGQRCYLQSLNGLLEKNGIKIRLQFPDRKKFLLAQLRGPFLLSFFALIFVMISYFITSRMFRKERQMVQHTSDFINNMVHEFQTPLSNIRFASNLIRKKFGTQPDEKLANYIEVIISENHKMEKNVEEILKVSCQNKGLSEMDDINIHNTLEACTKEFSARIESLNGKLQTEFNAEKSVIRGSVQHFKLIFSNLIDNAIKYSDGVPQISLTTENIRNNIKIDVTDKGIGIDKKYQSKIFEKYYRVSTGDVHNVKGFGLGLTYVKKLIEAHEGKISVISRTNSGTTFSIVLPLKNGTN